ncbi:MAG: molybdenum cofactor guanylyltransferase [Aquabacterium sp.]|jgi:molybdopterin-guanine dinucleotide biosynthesis protein A|uniref:molybdenum cofactor guanylyltransferase n=1 Tax=Aquabacterium sp. TaxID=1872578 RepID=UPI002A36B42B|nr:molybdenum cofactor guanylyltransferase [Aquabacterium sp.]MDX9842161.1 molybdenum cofactor guanylyltransferase [Aquabacterium sp.]
MTFPSLPQVTGCLLAGGEGRRMGGRDKGLVPYADRPLAAWVLDRLVAQTGEQFAIANRNRPDYATLLHQAHASLPRGVPAVMPDAPDLPPASGPVAGIVTALRYAATPWLMVTPCDTPRLPPDLVTRLLTEGERSGAEAVVPVTTDPDGQARHHWVCVLLRRSVSAKLEAMFAQDERKLRVCIQALNWTSVSFPDASGFDNINSLETLNGRD